MESVNLFIPNDPESQAKFLAMYREMFEAAHQSNRSGFIMPRASSSVISAVPEGIYPERSLDTCPCGIRAKGKCKYDGGAKLCASTMQPTQYKTEHLCTGYLAHEIRLELPSKPTDDRNPIPM